MRPVELMTGARQLAGNPGFGDVVSVHTGESGPTSEPVDQTVFVMNALAHTVTEKIRTLENAQTQLESFFPGKGLSLAVHMEQAKREAQLNRSY